MRHFFLVLVLSIFAFGQETQIDRAITKGNLNGRGWKKLRDEHRVQYVAGVADGIMLAVAEITFFSGKYVLDDWRTSALYVPRFSVGELKREIDQLYSETANFQIPVASAFGVWLL